MPGSGFGDVAVFVHGTTLATNAVIERRGARTALLATEGFRDVLDIANESRYDQYDLTIEKPKPLVPRALRFTVPERMDVHGHVRLALDEKAVRVAARKLEAEGAESVAVAFMHAYANPAHERRTRDILKEELPSLWITLIERGLPRGARVRTHVDRGRQRLCPAADGFLSRAHAGGPRGGEIRRHDLSRDLGWRPHRHRHGAALSGAAGRIRARPAARFLRRRSRPAPARRGRSATTWAAPRPRSA